jgi:hypothetical protein
MLVCDPKGIGLGQGFWSLNHDGRGIFRGLSPFKLIHPLF